MTAALSEAIKGFGTDDPHTAAARQNLAEQYRVMQKYDLALPLYNEVIPPLHHSLLVPQGNPDPRGSGVCCIASSPRHARRQPPFTGENVKVTSLRICLAGSGLTHKGIRPSGHTYSHSTAQSCRCEAVIRGEPPERTGSSLSTLQRHVNTKALHRCRIGFVPAGLHMAQRDTKAAVMTMQKAIGAKRLALGPIHPAVAESVLSLAVIYCASGQPRDAVELLQKEVKFLTEEGQASSPGDSQAPCSASGAAWAWTRV